MKIQKQRRPTGWFLISIVSFSAWPISSTSAVNVGDCFLPDLSMVPSVSIPNADCQSLQTCSPVQPSCASMPALGGCQFKKTHSYILVGTCDSIGESFTCFSCTPNNAVMLCMVYTTWSSRNQLGACLNQCVMFPFWVVNVGSSTAA